MAKTLNARPIPIHDTQSNWERAVGFVPKRGEIVIYDKDIVHNYSRIKVGDGVTAINDLPFVIDSALDQLFTSESGILYCDGGNITEYEDNE